ncbi:hypothetical protein IF2G_07479 [Cordyceps javanica]|nr:hypothetical protein IF2G_07479 [Cordyceps javanica]
MHVPHQATHDCVESRVAVSHERVSKNTPVYGVSEVNLARQVSPYFLGSSTG